MDVFSGCLFVFLKNIRPTDLTTLKDIISSVVVQVVNLDRKLSMGHIYQIFGVVNAIILKI